MSSIDFESEIRFDLNKADPCFYPLIFNISKLCGKPNIDCVLINSVKSTRNLGLSPRWGKYKFDLLQQFYSIILKINNKNGSLEFKLPYIRLNKFIENPLHYYFLNSRHSEIQSESILFSRFLTLDEEIIRDIVINENEREFLLKKNEDKGFYPSLIQKAENNNFIGLNTFKILVDRICENGVLTENDIAIIHEKALEYKLPYNIVKESIAAGLKKSKIILDDKIDESFYKLVLSTHVLNFVSEYSKENYLDGHHLFDIKSHQEKANIIESELNRIVMILEKILFTKIETSNIYNLLQRLGLKYPSKTQAIDIFTKNSKQRSLRNVSNEFELSAKEFKGFLYRPLLAELDTSDLFIYKIYANEVVIKINKSHPLLSHNPGSIEAISHILISMISTKIEYPNNRHIDHFWKLFSLYQKHYTMTQYE